jgi:hypothetical protein
MAGNVAGGVALWLAISGGACLIEMVARAMRTPPTLDLEET